jgi:hypothetical protein
LKTARERENDQFRAMMTRKIEFARVIAPKIFALR